MTDYDLYIFFLCFTVFTILTVLLFGMLYFIVKQSLRLIRCGEEDDYIIKEFTQTKKQSKAIGVFNTVVSVVLCVFFLISFIFSIYINVTEDVYFKNTPTLKVVKTGSMAEKRSTNEYLFKNDLNDQIKTFDLILTYELPEEKDLKLYDIVVYEADNALVVHRIVGIEEPNERHPNERWFTCQGDNVELPDRFPVHYSQMKGIYRGQRVAFVGSFILFMQSPAGWLCILLVVAAIIATPIIEKKILSEKKKRFKLIVKQNNLNTLSKEQVELV